MKTIADVVRAKEEEILRVKKEVEALRIVAGLLGEGEAPAPSERRTEYRQLLQMP